MKTTLNKKQLTITTLAIATLLVAGAAIVARETSASTKTNSTLAQRFAERFNLNESEVQAFFDEQKAAHRAHKTAQHEAYLDELVANGTITNAQKEALQDKHEELIETKQSVKRLSKTEQQKAMQSFHEEMKMWAENQGIDIDDIHGSSKHRSHHMTLH